MKTTTHMEKLRGRSEYETTVKTGKGGFFSFCTLMSLVFFFCRGPLNADDSMPDDFEANTGTTGAVEVGGEASGVIEKEKDTDWFAVELVAGRTYVIYLEGEDADEGQLDMMLRGLYDSAGRRIGGTRNRDGGEGGDALLTFTAAEDGIHYIAARGQGPDTGAYTVRVTEDSDATAAGATDLGDITGLSRTKNHRDSVDGMADGTDYYSFSLSEAKKVVLRLRGQDADADLYLEDGDGSVLDLSTREETRNERIDRTLEAGTYYARVMADEEGENTYTLSYRVAEPEITALPQEQVTLVHQELSRLPQDDYAADTSTTGTVAVGGSVTGNIEVADPNDWYAGDRDWFRVTLEAGNTYLIDLKGAATGHGTLADPYLRGIFDAEGTYIPGVGSGDAVSNSNGVNSRVLFTPPEAAAYYVEVRSSYGDGETGTYTLSVSLDDYAGDPSTTGTVAVGGSVEGAIDATGDRDWFKVRFEAGRTYQVDVKGEPTGDGTLADPVTGIFSPDGSGYCTGGWNDNGGLGKNARVVLKARESGTYHVMAEGAPGLRNGELKAEGNTGTYTLSVEEVVR